MRRQDEIEWIIEVTKHIIGRDNIALLEGPLHAMSPRDIMERFGKKIGDKINQMSPQKLGCICKWGQGTGAETHATDFYQMASLLDAGLKLDYFMSGITILRQTAIATIACIAHDYVRQAEYRQREEKADKSYALK